MKRLNKKGFTLVELLAVIIILAIVVGITIPAILNTTDKAKEKALETAAQTSADWIERQYQLWIVDSSSGDVNITLSGSNYFGVDASGNYKSFNIASTDEALIESAGLKPSNVDGMKVKINTKTGRVCVQLTGKGDYPVKTVTGGACTGVTFS